MEKIHLFLKDDKGQGMVEYGLIIALIAIAVITVLTAMGGHLNNLFTRVNDSLTIPPN